MVRLDQMRIMATPRDFESFIYNHFQTTKCMYEGGRGNVGFVMIEILLKLLSADFLV